MLLIFTLIQTKTLPATLRNAQVETIFKLFTVDQVAFRAYLLRPDITLNKKALIEKIIKEVSVRTATSKQEHILSS